ncbi:MAG: riboflavin biosynthesis protein RibD, partial [Betaproteobacteria bacterium HGW-Betaproteobacteria-17]
MPYVDRFSAADHAHMARALQLAARGLYTTSPNPRVGCVIVKNDIIVGEGWHERAGTPHAEIHALQAAGDAARGATAYVTLEPCSHHGRTPPCAEALIQAGVARVVAAMTDPNPLVAGGGISMLTLAGIEAEVGLMEAEARALNPGFVSRMTRGRPWLRLKTASSLDGKTALANGASQWITGAAARADVQALRARACAILTGSGTVLADNPRHVQLLAQVNLNLTASSLLNAEFHQLLHSQLQRHKLPADKLCIEVTEMVALGELGVSAQWIRQLREQGLKVALDDFG